MQDNKRKGKADMKLLVDNNETSFEDFVRINTEKEVQEITAKEIDMVADLKVNEFVFVGFVKVKRIK